LDIQFDRINQTVAAYRITVEPSDYEATYRQQIKELRKSLHMPGFRIGQVPSSIIEKKYGEKVLYDIVIDFCVKWLYEYIEDFKIKSLRKPEIVSITGLDFDENSHKNIEVVFHQVIAPDLEINLENLPRFKRYRIELTNEDFEYELRALRAKFGTHRETHTANLIDQYYQYHLELTPIDGLGNPLDERQELVSEFLKQVHENEAQLDQEPRPVSAHLSVTARYLSWFGGQLNSHLFGKSVNDQWKSNWSEMMFLTQNAPFFDESVPVLLQEIYKTYDFLIRIKRIDEITPHAIDNELHAVVFGTRPYKGADQFRMDFFDLLEEKIEQMSIDHLNRQMFSYLVQAYPVKIYSEASLSSFMNDVRANVKEHQKLDQYWYRNQYQNFSSRLLQEIYIISLVKALEDIIDLSDQAFEDYLYDHFRKMLAVLPEERFNLLPTTVEDGQTVIDMDLIVKSALNDEQFRLEQIAQFRQAALNSALWETGLVDTEEVAVTLETFRKESVAPLLYAS
jgi:hypothetical protein